MEEDPRPKEEPGEEKGPSRKSKIKGIDETFERKCPSTDCSGKIDAKFDLHRLDLNKINFGYEKRNKEKLEMKWDNFNEIITETVTNSKGVIGYKKADIEDKFKPADSHVQLFYKIEENKNKVLQHFGIPVENRKCSGTIIFIMFRISGSGTIDENDKIVLYALTAGHSWQTLRRFVDVKFHTDIPIKILDPAGANKLDITPLFGPIQNQKNKMRTLQLQDLTDMDFGVVCKTFSGVVQKDVYKLLFPQSNATTMMPNLYPKNEVEDQESHTKLIANEEILSEEKREKTFDPTSAEELEVLSHQFGKVMEDNCPTTETEIIKVTVGESYLKFHTNLCFEELPKLAKALEAIYISPTPMEFSKCSKLRKVAMPIIDSLTQFTLFSELDETFIAACNDTERSEAFTRIQKFDLVHKFVEKYVLAEKLFLKYGGMERDLGHNPSVGTLIQEIQNIQEETQKKCLSMSEIKLFYDDKSKENWTLLRFYLQGVFWSHKINAQVLYVTGKWYQVTEDSLLRIQRKFQQTLIDHLLPLDDIRVLPLSWPIGQKEGDYNDSFKKISDFYVGDRKTPLGIEYFDVLRDLESKSYFYHVKDDFGNTTRDCCSQLRNAHHNLKEFKSSQNIPSQHAGKFNEFVEKKVFESGVQMRTLLCLVGDRQPVFILSLRTNSNEEAIDRRHITNLEWKKVTETHLRTRINNRSLFHERGLKNEITQKQVEENFEMYRNQFPEPATTASQVLQIMVNAKYLLRNAGEPTKYSVTSRLVFCSGSPELQKFLGLSKEIVDIILHIFQDCRSYFPSLLAKMEIVRLAEYMNEQKVLGQDNFKICEIFPNKGYKKEKPSPKKVNKGNKEIETPKVES